MLAQSGRHFYEIFAICDRGQTATVSHSATKVCVSNYRIGFLLVCFFSLLHLTWRRKQRGLVIPGDNLRDWPRIEMPKELL